MTEREALKLALEALEKYAHDFGSSDLSVKAMYVVRQALAQPEQEPVAFINVEQRKLEWAKYMTWDTPTVVNLPKIPLYTSPPQREPLTDEQIILIVAECASSHQHTDIHFARAIERAHGIKELV